MRLIGKTLVFGFQHLAAGCTGEWVLSTDQKLLTFNIPRNGKKEKWKKRVTSTHATVSTYDSADCSTPALGDLYCDQSTPLVSHQKRFGFRFQLRFWRKTRGVAESQL